MNKIIKWSIYSLLWLVVFQSCDTMDVRDFHTVTFYSNGGTNLAPAKVHSGERLPKSRVYPDPIVSDGGTFMGWYADADLEEPYDFNQPVVGDIALYAKWYYNTFTVRFVMNGAPDIPEKEVREGFTVNVEPPTYPDHIFAGWHVDESLTTLYDLDIPVTEALTLYARWVMPSPSSWFVVDDGVLVQCTPPDGTEVVVIPEGVTTIPDWFVLANGLNEAGKPGFPAGKDIREFILPQSLENIGFGAFKFAAINRIEIPPKVRELLPVTFDGCDQLTSFTFAPESQLERLVDNASNEAIISAPALTEITFPPSLRFVGKYTLAGSQALQTVTFERAESPVIFDGSLPGGGVWLFGGHFPGKIRMPLAVVDGFVSEMRKVMQDYEFDNMSAIVEGY